MKIIFAQGNPGAQYAQTRHNVGFIFLDEIAKQHNVDFNKRPKFHADIAEMTIADEKVLLVKPMTFYNETGQSARQLIDFYKLIASSDLLVIHDDLALPFGTIRTRFKGSDAGNNGIKSINSHLGQEYGRIRVGIYNDLRERIPDADFVLSNFTRTESQTIHDFILPKVDNLIDAFCMGKFETTSHKLQQ